MARAVRTRRRARPLEQLAFELGPQRPRWVFSRLAARSPHLNRIRERIEFVRYFFPELEGITVRVGLAQKPGVLGWGSLDPERPGIWIRPRRLEYFTIAHEFVHLLQARQLVPRGERACDLWALARSPLVVDVAPGYLGIPRSMRGAKVSPGVAAVLCEGARRAIAAREAGDRRYLQGFERAMTAAFAPHGAVRVRRAAATRVSREPRKDRRSASDDERTIFERVRRFLVGGRG
jgi:hypothetical protein